MKPRTVLLPALLLALVAGCDRGAAPVSATEAELEGVGKRNDEAAVAGVRAQRERSRADLAAEMARLQSAEDRGRAAATETIRRADAEEAARVEGNRPARETKSRDE